VDGVDVIHIGHDLWPRWAGRSVRRSQRPPRPSPRHLRDGRDGKITGMGGTAHPAQIEYIPHGRAFLTTTRDRCGGGGRRDDGLRRALRRVGRSGRANTPPGFVRTWPRVSARWRARSRMRWTPDHAVGEEPHVDLRSRAAFRRCDSVDQVVESGQP